MLVGVSSMLGLSNTRRDAPGACNGHPATENKFYKRERNTTHVCNSMEMVARKWSRKKRNTREEYEMASQPTASRVRMNSCLLMTMVCCSAAGVSSTLLAFALTMFARVEQKIKVCANALLEMYEKRDGSFGLGGAREKSECWGGLRGWEKL